MHRSTLASVAGAMAVAWAASAVSAAVVFSDDFSTSTMGAGGSPTATKTDYAVQSTKNASASALTSGHLVLTLNAATTSGVAEGQALFANSPVTLSAAGDYIEFKMTFTNTAKLLAAGTSSFLYMGLYDAGSPVVAPTTGLANAGLAGTTATTGGAAGWQGYATRVAGSGGNSQTYTRPAQVGATTSAAQDLVGNNAGGGLYNSPAGTSVGSQVASTASLTDGSVYTDDLKITLNANGSLQVERALYSGTDTTGTALASQSVATGTTPLTTSFSGLAFGFRTSGTSYQPGMDVTSLSVLTNTAVATPEPAAVSLAGIAGLALLGRRRRA